MYVRRVCLHIRRTHTEPGCEELQRDGKKKIANGIWALASTMLHDVNMQWRYLFINVGNTLNCLTVNKYTDTQKYTQWYYRIVIESTSEMKNRNIIQGAHKKVWEAGSEK